MGGHGGLNILPQKRWNVYNRDNRLKVAQDEEKQRKTEEEAQRRHARAESEHRRDLLLQRARGHGTAQHSLQEGAGQVPSSQELLDQKQQPLEHINFFAEEEAAAAHPEVEKEQADEQRRRGNPDFYTSDARFDERFQLAYGLGKDQPWYTKRYPAPADLPANTTTSTILGPNSTVWSLPPVQCKAPPKLPPTSQPTHRSRDHELATSDRRQPERRSHKSQQTNKSNKKSNSKSNSKSNKSHKSKRKRRKTKELTDSSGSDSSTDGQSASSSSDSSDDSDSGSESEQSSDSSAKHGKKRKKRRSGKDKRDSKSRQSKEVATVALSAGGVKSIEQLRQERLQRELQERSKARQVLFGTLDGVPRTGNQEKRYHSAFGYAAAKK